MAKVLLLGGPTGVGKATALTLLQDRSPRSAVLDADHVWHVSQDLAVQGTRSIALSNVIGVVQGYVQVGCEVAILSWVFARPQLYEPVIAGLADTVDSVHQLYLIASREALQQRLANRQDSDWFDYSISRLELINQLPYPKIDTTHLSPAEVADQIATHISTLPS